MKNPIFLPIIVTSCSESTGAYKNTGSSQECLEGVTNKLVLGKPTFRFATLDDFKDTTKWADAIVAKDIAVLFDVYEVADNNTDAVKYETGNFSYVTEEEVKKMTAESYLSLCSHAALKSYQALGYNQVFEITTKGEVIGVYDSDGIKIKGQDITEFDIAIRSRPTKEKPAYSMQTLTYRDFNELEDNGVIVKEAWDIQSLNGVFGIGLEIVTASAAEIVVKATIGCGREPYGGLVLADWGGTVGAVTASAEADGTYTLDGTFASGTLATDGVITLDGWHYEAVAIDVVI